MAGYTIDHVTGRDEESLSSQHDDISEILQRAWWVDRREEGEGMQVYKCSLNKNDMPFYFILNLIWYIFNYSIFGQWTLTMFTKYKEEGAWG